MVKRSTLTYFKNAQERLAQGYLSIAELFLYGRNGLAPNMASALLWLGKAAQLGSMTAVYLIGEHIPLKVAFQHHSSHFMLTCYRETGIQNKTVAQWKFVQWIFSFTTNTKPPSRSRPVLPMPTPLDGQSAAEHLAHSSYLPTALKSENISNADKVLAVQWLRELAEQKIAGACWLLAKALHHGLFMDANHEQALHYAKVAAQKGEPSAVHWISQQILSQEEKKELLESIVHLLPELINRPNLTKDEAALLYEYANHFFTDQEITRNPTMRALALQALHRAAHNEFPPAQFLYGLQLGRLNQYGEALPQRYANRNSSLKKAAQWIELAGRNGIINAWYVLGKLYRRTQFSQYNPKQSNHYFLQAAQLGHAVAQFELGWNLWRSRKNNPGNDVKASYWIWQAAKKNIEKAQILLKKILYSHPATKANPWTELRKQINYQPANIVHALLAQRIDLAYHFNLSSSEMLLLDIVSATHEHCLIVDIHVELPRTKKKFILIETQEQFKALSHINKFFKDNEAATAKEGNYRQRRYRFNKLLRTLKRQKKK